VISSYPWTSPSSVYVPSFLDQVQFGFVSENASIVGRTHSCRDYLIDLLIRQINGADFYTLDYVHQLGPRVCLMQMRLSVIRRNIHDDDVERTLDLVHQMEDLLNIRPRSMVRTLKFSDSNFGPIMLWLGSKEWLIAPPMVSLYSLLIRVGQWHIVGNKWDQTWSDCIQTERSSRDWTNLSSGRLGIDRLIGDGIVATFGTDIKRNYPLTEDHNTHGYYGLSSFTSKSCKHLCPHWYKDG
jgi:hypothetical protein